MSETLEELAGIIKEDLGASVSETAIVYGELTVTAQSDGIIELLTFLRDNARCKFVSFIDICGVDWPQREKRFDVVYHLMSPQQNCRIRIKVTVAEGETLPSATSVYIGADWFEREAYDMFGILFTGHPDLRRILTDYGFEGHPLRKDFPTTGYVEGSL